MAIHFYNCSQDTEDQVKEILKFWESSRDEWRLKTSGSTGEPSSVILRRSALLASAQATLQYFGLKARTRALLCLPPAKVGGLMMVIRALVGDWELWVTEPSGRPLQEFSRDFDFVAMVPYQASRSGEDLSQVAMLLLGGGMVSSELHQHLAPAQKYTRIYQSYGMTETLSHVAVRELSGLPGASPYRALPGVSFHSDSRGCLVIDAEDRGLHGLVTNDLVDLMDAHTFHYRGRQDNVINSGGIKLHPEQLESRLQFAGFNLALVGLPDPRWGEKMVLVVERTAPLTIEEQQKLEAQLQASERPKDYFSIPRFPYTSNGKLQRAKLKQEVLARAKSR